MAKEKKTKQQIAPTASITVLQRYWVIKEGKEHCVKATSRDEAVAQAEVFWHEQEKILSGTGADT